MKHNELLQTTQAQSVIVREKEQLIAQREADLQNLSSKNEHLEKRLQQSQVQCEAIFKEKEALVIQQQESFQQIHAEKAKLEEVIAKKETEIKEMLEQPQFKSPVPEVVREKNTLIEQKDRQIEGLSKENDQLVNEIKTLNLKTQTIALETEEAVKKELKSKPEGKVQFEEMMRQKEETIKEK